MTNDPDPVPFKATTLAVIKPSEWKTVRKHAAQAKTFAQKAKVLEDWLDALEEPYATANAISGGGAGVVGQRADVLHLVHQLHPAHQEYILSALGDLPNRDSRSIHIVRRDFRHDIDFTGTVSKALDRVEKARERARRGSGRDVRRAARLAKLLRDKNIYTEEDQLFVIAYERDKVVLRFTNFPERMG